MKLHFMNVKKENETYTPPAPRKKKKKEIKTKKLIPSFPIITDVTLGSSDSKIPISFSICYHFP